jgi:hypothetical protein
MDIQFNTNSSVMGTENVAERIEAQLRDRLGRFEERLTRLEVHVRDENGPKGGGGDKVCTIEARPRGGNPVSVTAQAADVDAAARDAPQLPLRDILIRQRGEVLRRHRGDEIVIIPVLPGGQPIDRHDDIAIGIAILDLDQQAGHIARSIAADLLHIAQLGAVRCTQVGVEQLPLRQAKRGDRIPGSGGAGISLLLDPVLRGVNPLLGLALAGTQGEGRDGKQGIFGKGHSQLSNW